MDENFSLEERAVTRAMARYMPTLKLFLASPRFRAQLEQHVQERVDIKQIIDDLCAAHDIPQPETGIVLYAAKPVGAYDLTAADWEYLKEMKIRS